MYGWETFIFISHPRSRKRCPRRPLRGKASLLCILYTFYFDVIAEQPYNILTFFNMRKVVVSWKINSSDYELCGYLTVCCIYSRLWKILRVLCLLILLHKKGWKTGKFSLLICRDDSPVYFVSILRATRHIQPSWIVIVETNLHFACYRLFRLTESIDKKLKLAISSDKFTC